MSIVLDCSVALAWVYANEASVATEHVLDLVTLSGACVPAIWPLEVANALQQGVRRGRISAAERDASLADLALLNIAVDPDTNVHAWKATLRLAERFGLTSYDASYLELAQRQALPLASLDSALRIPGGQLGVTLLGMDATTP